MLADYRPLVAFIQTKTIICVNSFCHLAEQQNSDVSDCFSVSATSRIMNFWNILLKVGAVGLDFWRVLQVASDFTVFPY